MRERVLGRRRRSARRAGTSTPVCRKPIQLVMPRRIARPLRHPRERVDGAPRQQPEVARVGGDVGRGHAAEEPVERADGEQPETRLALAPLADRVDDVEALVPALDEIRDHLRRILQVAVDEHDRVAARRVEPGGERDLVAEVPRQAKQPNVRSSAPRARAARPTCRRSSRRRRTRSRSGPAARAPRRAAGRAPRRSRSRCRRGRRRRARPNPRTERRPRTGRRRKARSPRPPRARPPRPLRARAARARTRAGAGST